MSRIAVRVKEDSPSEFDNVEDAETYVRSILEREGSQVPSIFQIEVDGAGMLGVGVGPQGEVFLHYVRTDGEPPYLVSQGGRVGGSIDFFLFGEHHTEVSRDHLIGANEAITAIVHFLHTGELLDELRWAEA